jgi:hypothetical protein
MAPYDDSTWITTHPRHRSDRCSSNGAREVLEVLEVDWKRITNVLSNFEQNLSARALQTPLRRFGQTQVGHRQAKQDIQYMFWELAEVIQEYSSRDFEQYNS